MSDATTAATALMNDQGLAIILGAALFTYLVYKGYKKRVEVIEKKAMLDELPDSGEEFRRRWKKHR